MAGKAKVRAVPNIDREGLVSNFAEQLTSGSVFEAVARELALPSLDAGRGEPVRVGGCLLVRVTLREAGARQLWMQDVRVEQSDLANVDLSGGRMERVEVVETRMTGAVFR